MSLTLKILDIAHCKTKTSLLFKFIAYMYVSIQVGLIMHKEAKTNNKMKLSSEMIKVTLRKFK